MRALTLFILILTSLSAGLVKSEPSVESSKAYEKAQAMRTSAGNIIESSKDKEALQKAETILLKALLYVRSDKIRSLYANDIYLAARQWDILRDLVEVNALQKDRAGALLYLSEFQRHQQALYRVATNAAVVNLLKNERLFRQLVGSEKAWSRIFEVNTFSSPFQDNLTNAEKIAGLSLFWSEAKYNFVYFDQIPDLNWDETYKKFIPKVLATENSREYFRVLMRLAALLQDGHSNVYPPSEIIDQYFAAPPLRTRLMDDKVIITAIYSKSLKSAGLKVGDELLKINDVSVHKYANDFVRPFQSSSTKQDKDLRTYSYSLLRGDKDQTIKLKIKTESGKRHELLIKRIYTDRISPIRHVFKILKNNIAYISLDGFGDEQSLNKFIKSFPQIRKASGLIIDVRKNGGGSSGYGMAVLGYLTHDPVIGSSQRTREYLGTLRAWGERRVSWKVLGGDNAKRWIQPEIFEGPVSVLIGAGTFSAGEDFAVAFEMLKRGTLIGQTTGGSTGQPLFFELPGGGSARVTSKRDGYPNGEDWVGVGIKPNIEVKPTVQDIRQGVDPVLNKAIEVLLKSQ